MRDLLAILALLALTELGRAPVAPASEDPAALMSLHAELLEDQPRPAGSRVAEHTRRRIQRWLEDRGLAVTPQRTWSCRPGRCAAVENLWSVQPGRGRGLLLLAHTDSVPAGPGAADAGAGLVGVLSAFARARDLPRDRPLLLALTDAEEDGLLGAKVLPNSPLWSRVGAVVNFEARGTGGPLMLFQILGPTGAALRWLPPVPLSTSSLHDDVYERLPNGTDLSALPSGPLLLDHAFLAGVARYHTPLDDRDHLNPTSLAQTAAAAWGWTQTLTRAEAPLEAWPPGEVTFVDLLGRWRLAWPRWLSATLALPLVLLAGPPRLGELGRALLAILALIVPLVLLTVAGLGTWGPAAPLARLVAVALAAVVGSWWSDPLPARARALAATLALGLLATALSPGLAAYLLPISVGVALAGRWGLPGLLLASLWAWPLARGLDEALGGLPWLLPGLLPVLAAAPRAPSPLRGALTAGAAIAAATLALAAPAAGPDHPLPWSRRLAVSAAGAQLAEGPLAARPVDDPGLLAPRAWLVEGGLAVESSRGAERLVLGLPPGTRVMADGQPLTPNRSGQLELIGRLNPGPLVLDLDPWPAVLHLSDLSFDLPPAVDAAAPRPRWGLPVHAGDRTEVHQRVELQQPSPPLLAEEKAVGQPEVEGD